MARATPRRRADAGAGGPGWGNVLADLAVLVVVVGIGVGIAEAVDWQGSRSFRLQFFGVVTFGLVGGYVAMIVWKGAHEGGRVRRSRRHARRGRRSSRHSH